MSTVAALQVPLIPLSEVVGSVGTADPAHMLREVPKLKVGVMFGFTVTVKLVLVAQTPAVGVKV